ncbi:hypothetical protein A2526_05280 [candidate division WOR-1 bacterium RIFOXYD2_FULL_36_8]|uniref:Outer membrane protein beta-barrel domain-containing protein n=1 Tax=candidate division WOR-1 bacterium RIFOXYB2_FULL_36_35 TaxID=1802578 RepID=A0A1F4S0R6_UNCSA|nr:MAG: hypothetical protein A2230_06715 [candidate division WOR-1 bacterium RIFOXYA2_FULL_36_21]OGC14036.1 MAG: hypothetical protein A2290_02470 [candidate division WOR-1 bacterium RIFOXYB2_FULL_36_35]OGC14971.1 MAG: hypothetical protein A2282_07005 [candidate division WOR-1 bacterium RIFOXYA12_FULL_36_13]OGC38274.1 MAG: hypothetical protein A2526_05280 [candidate division WOR-1 bacterium RIFOXYD2_FULL_36_8]
MKKSFISMFLVCFFAGLSFATPSTQIWNPSTDIQGVGVLHFGIDNYFTQEGPIDGGYAFPTDLGLTYGIFPGFEIGADIMLPQQIPFVFNAKYGIGEKEILPSFAIGGFGFGTQKDVTDQNVLYGVVAKTFPVAGRFTAGYFSGNERVLIDPTGAKDNAGLILTWDKAINDKLWACVDYAGTKSALGATFYGISWMFSGNTSVIFGYGTYNNGAKPTFTTQLDINI